MGVGLAVTWDAWSDLLNIAWSHEESSHILLVPVVFGWLVWVRRERFQRLPAEGGWIGPVLVAAGWAFYSLGDLNLIQAFWHGGAVLVAVGCLLSVGGWQVLRRFLPAFVILVFLVPVPGTIRQAIALPLQAATARATQLVLDVFGIDVARSGNVLVINGNRVAIAEACNGLRMVFALVLVSFTFALGTPLRWYVRVIIVLASPLSAVLCNVIRLVPTVWLYGYATSETAQRFHDISGWVMLPIAFLILLGILRVLRWALLPVHRFTLAYGV